MNGAHDLGGMQGFGPVRPEPNEPVFHAAWEARVYAMMAAMFGWGRWNLDELRYGFEALAPADYLTMSYYERWHAALVNSMIRAGMLTPAELASGRSESGNKAVPPVNAIDVPAYVHNGGSFKRDVAVRPRFRAGQRVRARNINPPTHTRLPRYARGKIGAIVRDYGVFVFPDSNAEHLGEKPQHLYSVRFTARELWGEQAKAGDNIYLDLWDDYLDRA